MKSKAGLFWLGVLFLFSGSMIFWTIAKSTRHGDAVGATAKPIVLKSGPPIEQFTLTEQSGKPFRSESLDGEIWVASFFLIKCREGRCDRQNLHLAELDKEYGPRGVRFLSITCDPKKDNPLELARYADRFGADPKRWLFLTGDMNYIERVGRDILKVTVKEQTHSESFIVVGPKGAIRGYFSWQNPADFAQLKRLLDELIREKQQFDQQAPEQQRAVAADRPTQDETSTAPPTTSGQSPATVPSP